MQLISSYFPSIMRDFSLGTVAAVDDTFHAVPTAFSPLFLNNYMIHYVWGSFARGKIHIFHIQIHTHTHRHTHIYIYKPFTASGSELFPTITYAELSISIYLTISCFSPCKRIQTHTKGHSVQNASTKIYLFKASYFEESKIHHTWQCFC